MNCLNCEADNDRDFPLCKICEPTCHFTNRDDCRCLACDDARDLAALPAALQERLRGSVLIATSDDPPDTVRIKFSLDALKPECRRDVARAVAALVTSAAQKHLQELAPGGARG